MCRASFIQNEKVDTIRRIPPISSYQFFAAYTRLNTHHPLPNYYTLYDTIGLNVAVSIRSASYFASTCHPLAWEATLDPPPFLWQPGGLAGQLVSVLPARDRDLGGHRYYLKKVLLKSAWSG